LVPSSGFFVKKSRPLAVITQLKIRLKSQKRYEKRRVSQLPLKLKQISQVWPLLLGLKFADLQAWFRAEKYQNI
jgi:hypothetical protein